MQRGEIIKGARRPPKRQLEPRIGTSNKHLLTLVTDGQVQYAKLFGGRGYQHIITAAGMDYARGIASEYAALLDQEKFLTAWRKFASQMRAKNAREPQRATGRPMGGGSVVEEEENVRITRDAPYGENDFEW
jgi:hypothetical protein